MVSQTLLRTALLSALVACATDEAIETTTEPTEPHGELEQVAKITSYTGTTVEIFTAGTGFMAVELGDKDLPRAIAGIDGLSLADVYRVATREEPPARITALSSQLEIAPVSSNPPPVRRYAQSTPELVAPQSLAAAGSCSATWMQNQGFCSGGAGTDWSLLNWWNGAYEHFNGVYHSSAALCADIGDIVWEIHNGAGGHHTWTVLQGQLFTYWASLGGDWLHYDVTHASNNRFQFCGWASIP